MFSIKTSMPGIDKKDIKASLDKGYLTVSGESKKEKKEKGYYFSDQRSFSYCSSVPKNVKPSTKPKIAMKGDEVTVSLEEKPKMLK